jgi:large subunit ribosomal protein L18
MKPQIRTVPHRRKRQSKTDYKSRLGLLKSKEHRFVVRKSLKQMLIQAIEYNPSGDKVLFTVSSSELKKLGWKNSTSNIPSAYLTGLLAGKKAKEMKIKKGIFDLGINLNIKGSRFYSALKGLIDAGIQIPASEDIFPSEDRLVGKHISNYKKIDIEKDFNDMKKKLMV